MITNRKLLLNITYHRKCWLLLVAPAEGGNGYLRYDVDGGVSEASAVLVLGRVSLTLVIVPLLNRIVSIAVIR